MMTRIGQGGGNRRADGVLHSKLIDELITKVSLSVIICFSRLNRRLIHSEITLLDVCHLMNADPTPSSHNGPSQSIFHGDKWWKLSFSWIFLAK
jgi:hypothetical protein